MLPESLNIVGAGILVLGSLTYLADTLRGKIQPNRVTWLLWAAAPFIVFFAEIKQGVGIHALLAFVGGFMPLLIFLATFINKNAYWKIGRLDIACGALSALGLVLWYITGTGNTAIFFSIMADTLAAIPTIIKAYKYPETENYIEYVASGLSGGITLLTIKTWNFAYYGFPFYFLLINTALAILIKYKVGKKFNVHNVHSGSVH